MPKQRQTCTRCSMRRQKCDRKSPCSRCVLNHEGHLCTTEWKDGYNPSIHRKYPRKSSPTASQRTTSISSTQDLPTHLQSERATSNDQAEPVEPPQPATNVDFVTFGRSADLSDISIGSLIRDANMKSQTLANEIASNPALNQVANKGTFSDYNTALTANETLGGFSPAAKAVEVYHIQSLLPAKDKVMFMVDYHIRCMLYWNGGSYHGPTFRRSVEEAYGQADELDLRNLDWRWTSLLFSVLSASIMCSAEAISTSWGFLNEEKIRHAKQWANAAMSCLLLGDFNSKYHIYSIQAILNLHASEHLVGSTKEWTISQSVAITIARGLNLHKLGPHPDDGKQPSELSAEQKDALLQREVGRRLWSNLTAQDWLCSTSQQSYSIQKRHFTSILPGCFHDETMTPVTNDMTPTHIHGANHLYRVADLLVSYHDAVLDASDLRSKYALALEYDSKMRVLSTEGAPKFLTLQTPPNPSWPRWAFWLRSLHEVSCAHKIIMIHQAFLGKSFKDPRYTYSRWACSTSSKTIIDTMSIERDAEQPQWWVEQAFVVTAGLCLVLDLFHRSEPDPEITQLQGYIERTRRILETWPTSSVAKHGITLLSSLMNEHAKKMQHQGARPNINTNGNNISNEFSNQAPITTESTTSTTLSNTSPPTPHASSSSIPSATTTTTTTTTTLATDPLQNQQPLPPLTTPFDYSSLDVDNMAGFEDLMETLPLEAGFYGMSAWTGNMEGSGIFFDGMMGFANGQFT